MRKRKRARQVQRIYVLEFQVDDAWLVSIDAMPFTSKWAAQARAEKFMRNSPQMKYRVAMFKRGQP